MQECGSGIFYPPSSSTATHMDHIIGDVTENNTSKGLCLTYRDAVGWDEQQFRM